MWERDVEGVGAPLTRRVLVVFVLFRFLPHIIIMPLLVWNVCNTILVLVRCVGACRASFRT